MEVEQQSEILSLSAPAIITALLNEFSAVTDYHTLRDSLPRRLATLLRCRCVLLYQRIGETLQFAAGSFDDIPGWSTALLSIAHINPIDLNSNHFEAQAWQTRHAITNPPVSPNPPLVAVPLIYRQRAAGVLVAFRSNAAMQESGGHVSRRPDGRQGQFIELASWSASDLPVLEAVASVVALLLENTRLLERDRERIQELSLLNSISSQLNCSMYDNDRIQSIIIQRTKEITGADLCQVILLASPSATPSSWLSSTLQEMLLAHFSKQQDTPLVIERPGDRYSAAYLEHLPANIKTFFAIPLRFNVPMHWHSTVASLRGRGIKRIYPPDTPYRDEPLHGYPQETLPQRMNETGDAVDKLLQEPLAGHEPDVLGIIAGAYYRTCKLRREELVLLQVLANQASAVLENMRLVTDVIEARNEARKLLRQVLDDQRLKELILKSVPSGLIAFDLAGRITTFNRAAGAILGYHPYEALGQPVQDILNVPAPIETFSKRAQYTLPALSDQLATRYAMPGVSETMITVERQGREIVLNAHFVPLHNDQYERIGTLVTFTDVTSIHRLEEEKRRLDRLATLGEMAASVAHEVRNPLASIKTSMQMLKDDLSGNQQDITVSKADSYFAPGEGARLPSEARGEALESVQIVQKEVERLDAIVRDLLLFAKPRQLHCVACNLTELSDHVLNMIQTQCLEAGIVIHRVYQDVPPVYVDVAQIEQVLLNLYTNAVQAMPEGGILTISCRVVPAHTIQEAHQTTAVGAGAAVMGGEDACIAPVTWVELSVSDTGTGIAPEQIERIFQPFFTTKAHGIGLGLPITRRLVEDHGGQLLVESQFGYGATFSVRLPIVDAEV